MIKFKKVVLPVAFALMAAFALVATGCASASSEDAIRQAVSQELDIYKNLDEEAMNMVMESAESEGLTDLGIDGREFATAVLDGFDYTINSVTIDGNHATANVTITSKSMSDFEQRLNDSASALVDAPSTSLMSSDEIKQKVGELAMETFGETEIIDETIDIEFELKDSTWVSTNVADALGNLDSMVFAN